MNCRLIFLTSIYLLAAGPLFANPVIDTPATATPNPAEVNVPVALSVAAHDSSGGSVFYEWTIGGRVLLGPTLDFTFTAPGIYPVTVTISDESKNTAISTVDVVIGQEVGVAATLKSVKGSLNKMDINKDTITFNGTLTLPAGIKPTNPVTVLFSNGETQFSADKHGMATNPQGKAKFKLPKTGTTIAFQIRLTTPLAQALSHAGVDLTVTKGKTAPHVVPFVISTSEIAGIMAPKIVLSAKGKTGTAISGK
ncbi:MAG TPA: PKD domain-containing protein [Planctomycetota bacterium]|jgi:hypothetical protein